LSRVFVKKKIYRGKSQKNKNKNKKENSPPGAGGGAGGGSKIRTYKIKSHLIWKGLGVVEINCKFL
jgi:hypothetical protein